MPIIKERRRFTDVMEEESEKTRDARLEAWGRDDFSIFKPKKVQQSTETVEMEVLSILMAYYLGFFTAFYHYHLPYLVS